jgi:hypothetical protein
MKLSSKLSAPAGEVKQATFEAFVKTEPLQSHNFHAAAVFTLGTEQISYGHTQTAGANVAFPLRKAFPSQTEWDIAMGDLL